MSCNEMWQISYIRMNAAVCTMTEQQMKIRREELYNMKHSNDERVRMNRYMELGLIEQRLAEEELPRCPQS